MDVKNLKVSMKLVISFLIVTFLAVIVGIVGIVSLNSLNSDYTYAVNTHGKPLEDAGHALADIHAVRAELRGAMLFTGDVARVTAQEELVQGFLTEFETSMAEYSNFIVQGASRELFDEAMGIYDTTFIPAVEKTLSDAKNGVAQTELAAYMLSTIKPAVDKIVENVEQCMTNKAVNLDTTSAAGASLAQNMLFLLVGILILAVIIAMFLAFYISGLISKPLRDMMGYIKQAGETGNLKFRDDEWANCDKLSLIRDEIGQCMKAFTQMMRKFVYYGEVVGTVAEKDLTVTVNKLGDHDTFGTALESMVDSLNKMFADINNASNQVSTGSVQIADGAQLLAQGATEQSATVEELSASVTEVNGQTKANAGLANDAKKLGEDIRANAERGNAQMEQMIKAVGEISDASTAIGKVIKIIDDIAFQTNILALNAAVEAARAGQHGKGFAVVADEVRSLAAKSAEAAKNTSELIATSIQKSEQGAAISKETAESLSQIVGGIVQSSELVAKIAESSNAQSISISQIGEAIDQVSQVIQQNSATAEESAAASEEMSGQAAMLQQLIAQFRLKAQGANNFAPAAREASYASGAATPSTAMALGAGKY
jgi:methyl-accepting chemotaxis protein